MDRVYGEALEAVEPAVRHGPAERGRTRALASAAMRSVLGAVGRVLVVAGILLLLFVAYQLWGTGIYQARAQDNLRSQFEQTLQRESAPTTTTPATPTSTLPPGATTDPRSADGAARRATRVGIIAIPRIGVNQVFVEGVDVADLRKGPGHYPSTQLPGHEGNSAIAGHRTTYGAPFGDLDQLAPGDEIDLATVQGKFKYKVTDKRVVDPNEVSVLDPIPDPARAGHDLATLTLTTCNPKYSAAQRLIVQARLVATPRRPLPLPPAKTATGRAATSINGLSGETSSRVPALVWGAIAALIGLLWWLLFHRHPRWTTWLIGAVPFLAALFVCYMYVERLLPSNY